MFRYAVFPGNDLGPLVRAAISLADPRLARILDALPMSFASGDTAYFASMVPRVSRAFLRGLAYFGRSVRPEPVVARRKAIIRTLSPVFVDGFEPRDAEFRELVTDELERRIVAFRGVTGLPNRPVMRTLGAEPVRIKIRGKSIEARNVRLSFEGPGIYLEAALLGGLGLRTQHGLGFATIEG